MSAPTLIRRELSNARLYFLPAGETVDSVTVAAETWPDEVPTTNYTAYEWPDIEKMTDEKKVQEEIRMIPSASGGYVEDPEEMVVMRKWLCTTAKTNNHLKRLAAGLASAVVADTPQELGEVTDNYVDGVCRIDLAGKDGVLLESYKFWARIRLVSPGEVGPATRAIEFSVEKRYSSLNTYTAN